MSQVFTLTEEQTEQVINDSGNDELVLRRAAELLKEIAENFNDAQTEMEGMIEVHADGSFRCHGWNEVLPHSDIDDFIKSHV